MNFDLPHIPERTERPRQSGLTMMMDKGLSVREAENFISSSAGFTDLVKFGFGTALITRELEKKIRKVFDLTPAGIIESLDLRRPIYQKTAAFGHFGRTEPEFTWELTNKVDELVK